MVFNTASTLPLMAARLFSSDASKRRTRTGCVLEARPSRLPQCVRKRNTHTVDCDNRSIMRFPEVLPYGIDDTELLPVVAFHTDLGGREGPGEIGQEFTQPLSRFREDLEQARGRVDGIVISEIPVGEENVSAHLSGEECPFLLHLPFDQRVAARRFWRCRHRVSVNT